jgi:glycosyltransferase involved in cell wall biosynthesis
VKVWQVFNRYRETVNGEEHAVRNTHELLNARGIRSRLMLEDSGSVVGPVRKLSAAAGSVYNRAAYRRMRRAIRADRPDIVHAHNLLPLFSPAVLQACRDESVPVVVTVHSFFLTCPVHTHFRDGRLCHSCTKSSEFACLYNNCRDNLLESAAYALRTWTARKLQLYGRHANAVIALSRFARGHLLDYGFKPEQVTVLPNFSPLQAPAVDVNNGEYVACASRLNSAKGIDLLHECARQVDMPIRIAGTGDHAWNNDAVGHVEYVGLLSRDEMLEFYSRARFVVVPSRWYEMCPLVILEAMSLGLPVVASDIGGLPELVEHDETGLLFREGDADDLAKQMQRLWSDSALRSRLGAAARRKAQVSYSPDAHFTALTDLYQRIIGA